MEVSAPFGVELRRLRLSVGMTLTRLAELAHYSKSHISKIELGMKAPSPELARLCDSLLNANGQLSALVPRRGQVAPAASERTSGAHGDELWSVEVGADGATRFRLLDRRKALAAGATSLLVFGLASHNLRVVGGDQPLDTYRALFAHFRALGQTASPAAVLPGLVAVTQVVQALVARVDHSTRPQALRLAARYAEYVGWMCQEAGHERSALWWTDRSADLAEAGGDQDFASHALVRRALVAMYRHDAAETVALARRAQAGLVSARVRRAGALREAQGHALHGDRAACLRSLDAARALIGAVPERSDPLVLGSASLADPVGVVTGWCLHDLGRPAEAAEVLDRAVAAIPANAWRARTRFGVRRALAHAAAGDPERACEIASPLLDIAPLLRSATIRVDVHELNRALSRFRAHRSVRDLLPKIAVALSVAA